MNGLRAILLVALIYAGAVAETALTDAMAIGPIVPMVLPLLAVVWVLVVEERHAIWAAVAAGLVSDLAGSGRVGPGAFWLLLAAWGVTRLHSAWPTEHWFWKTFLTVAALTAWGVFSGLTRWFLGEIPLGVGVVLQRAVLAGAYTGVLSFPLWLLTGWLREPETPRYSEPTGVRL